MTRILALLLVALATAVPAVRTAEPESHHAAAAPTDPRFEFLAGLAGAWVATEGGPELPAGALFEFRLTAGGTAIEEREMIGSPHEMVTLYHMEGDELVATHYCMLGNQPRMRAARRIVDDTLSFACNGRPGNARSHDDAHIHAWSLRLGQDGRIHYSAQMAQNGAVAEQYDIVLTRQSESASR